MQSHYRKSLVFSYENLDNAAIAYGKLVDRIVSILGGEGEVEKEKFAELKKNFTDALDNDLNTALAVTAVYDVLKAETNNATKLALIKDFETVLSLGLVEAAQKQAKKRAEKDSGEGEEIPEEILSLLEQRKAARKEKNFALADEIRDKISGLGYVVTETREGTKVSRK